MGIEKIVDIILSFLNDILPFFVVKTWQESVVLRFGKVHRMRGPGIYLKIPFVDEPLNTAIVTTTIETPAQTLVTSDGQDVTLRSVIKYRISDVVAYTTEIYDATDAVMDFTQGSIMREVNTHTYDECRAVEAVSATITKKVRSEVKKYGIYIEQITLTNFIRTRNFRIFKDDTE